MCINLKCGEFGEKTKSNVSNISKDETNTKTADEMRSDTMSSFISSVNTFTTN